MRKVVLSLILFVALGFTVKLVAAPSSKPIVQIMSFHPANSETWENDNELPEIGPDVDTGHLYYGADHQVDISLVRRDDDLAPDLNSRGKDAVVADLMDGANMIDRLFNQPETKVLDSKLERDALVSILTLHTKQERESETVESIEKYFIASGQYVRAELRWKSDADAKAVKQARADFENGKLNIDGMKK